MVAIFNESMSYEKVIPPFWERLDFKGRSRENLLTLMFFSETFTSLKLWVTRFRNAKQKNGGSLNLLQGPKDHLKKESSDPQIYLHFIVFLLIFFAETTAAGKVGETTTPNFGTATTAEYVRAG